MSCINHAILSPRENSPFFRRNCQLELLVIARINIVMFVTHQSYRRESHRSTLVKANSGDLITARCNKIDIDRRDEIIKGFQVAEFGESSGCYPATHLTQPFNPTEHITKGLVSNPLIWDTKKDQAFNVRMQQL